MLWIGPIYEVTYLTGGQLEVSDTPSYAVAFPCLFISAASAIYFCYRMYRSQTLFPAWGFVWCLPWLLFGVTALRTGSLTLDKNAGTASFHRPQFLRHHDFVIDLKTIKHAEIRSMRSTTYIAIVLESGPPLTFADSTDADGQDAMEAINRYLGVSGRLVGQSTD